MPNRVIIKRRLNLRARRASRLARQAFSGTVTSSDTLWGGKIGLKGLRVEIDATA